MKVTLEMNMYGIQEEKKTTTMKMEAISHFRLEPCWGITTFSGGEVEGAPLVVCSANKAGVGVESSGET